MKYKQKPRQYPQGSSFTVSNGDSVQKVSELNSEVSNANNFNETLVVSSEQIDDGREVASTEVKPQSITYSEPTVSDNKVENIDPNIFLAPSVEDQHHFPVELKSEGEPDIRSYLGRIYSHAEALEKAKNLDNAAEEHEHISDELIMLMFILLAGDGLRVLGYKNWKAYFETRLNTCSYSLTTRYHYAEIAQFALDNRIVPLSDTTKSFRAICRSKAAIRQAIWDDAKERSGLDVPPVPLLQEIHAEHNKINVRKVDAVFASLTAEKSQDEILKIYNKVLNRIENIKNDEYRVEAFGVIELKKLKSSFDAHLAQHALYQNVKIPISEKPQLP